MATPGSSTAFTPVPAPQPPTTSAIMDVRWFALGVILLATLVIASFAAMATRAYRRRLVEQQERAGRAAAGGPFGQLWGVPGPEQAEEVDGDALLAARRGPGGAEAKLASPKVGIPVFMPGDDVPSFVAEASSPLRGPSLRREAAVGAPSPAASAQDVEVEGESRTSRYREHTGTAAPDEVLSIADGEETQPEEAR